MWGEDWVEACGKEGERIHLRQDKGERSLLNTPQGSGGPDSRGEDVFQEVVWGGCF